MLKLRTAKHVFCQSWGMLIVTIVMRQSCRKDGLNFNAVNNSEDPKNTSVEVHFHPCPRSYTFLD